ncbi:MAG: DUF502 domain-containing protein [Endomicrobium sp.]|jgi:uncharacterized membrane protein|nr:DUF502 domain-containing protein [Endomicrobium sp.]
MKMSEYNKTILNLINNIKNLTKKYLITGLIVIIPIWVTYFIVSIIFEWASSFTFSIISKFVKDTYLARIVIKLLSFFVSIMCVVIFGFITNRVFGKSILNSIEKFLKKLPILGIVYSSAKQFISFIFSNNDKKNFKKVIFVRYPNEYTYSIAFSTGKQLICNKNYICAFMPTTPNPTTGFLLLFEEKDIVYSDYTMEQAFKFIISAGVINMKNISNNNLKIKEDFINHE